MTNSEEILDYLQVTWSIADPAVGDVLWTHEWFDWKDHRSPQIVVSPMWAYRQETWNTGGSYDMRAAPAYAINMGYFIPVGSPGTAEAQSLENMQREIARIFREGLGFTPKYGGSLTNLRIAIPDGFGRKLNEMDKTPRLVRTELLLRCTEDM